MNRLCCAHCARGIRRIRSPNFCAVFLITALGATVTGSGTHNTSTFAYDDNGQLGSVRGTFAKRMPPFPATDIKPPRWLPPTPGELGLAGREGRVGRSGGAGG